MVKAICNGNNFYGNFTFQFESGKGNQRNLILISGKTDNLSHDFKIEDL